jgi:hypothetical protein
MKTATFVSEISNPIRDAAKLPKQKLFRLSEKVSGSNFVLCSVGEYSDRCGTAYMHFETYLFPCIE